MKKSTLIPTLLVSLSCSAFAAPPKPNILFVFTDDQRWDAIGYEDNPVIQTPTLDRLANDELRVELRSTQIDELKRELRSGNRRSIRAIIGGSFVISASIIIGLDGLAPIMVGSGQLLVPLASLALFIPGIYLLISSYYD